MSNKQSVAQHIVVKGMFLDEPTGLVLGSVLIQSPLGEELLELLDRYETIIGRVQIEKDLDSLERLEEVYMKEGIENRARYCIEKSTNAAGVLTIKGFLPPAIEIYRQTTSFVPASFRPDGYPGTVGWFEQMDQPFGV